MIGIGWTIAIALGFAIWSVLCLLVGYSLALQAKPKQPNPRLN